MFFLHTHIPDSILITVGTISIHWYGFLITLAVIVGFVIASFLFKQHSISKDHLLDLGFYLVIFGLLGARLAHVIVELPYYIAKPDQILAFWNGGLAIHGAIFGGVLVMYFYSRKYFNNVVLSSSKDGQADFDRLSLTKKRFFNFLLLSDILVVPLALGQAIGRWGNYFNQELYGRPTDLPWGIPILVLNRVSGFENFTHFHPTFLYESLANLVLFLVLLFLHKRRIRHPELVSGSAPEIPDQVRNDGLFSKPGFIFSIYLLGYSIIRLLVELLRIDRQLLFIDVRLAIIVSGLLIIVALWLIWYIYKQQRQRV